MTAHWIYDISRYADTVIHKGKWNILVILSHSRDSTSAGYTSLSLPGFV